AFERGGGDGPRYGQITMCWAEDEAAARRTALEYWPNSAIPGQLASELPTPSEFEDAAELVTEDALAEKLPCGPDLDRVVEQAEAFEKAGFTHLHLHQIGPDQEGFLRVAAEELLDRLAA
ncbi:MAG TPA: LLM class F420-dependent oxidoreductase, partial [Microthrixaceae bacterium]|nr:LLM class F420-dependent oxidoreductase [Microthrixaceae bacterium]